MPTWDVRVEVHERTRWETRWQGEAVDREEAIRLALRHAAEQRGRPLELATPISVTVATV